MDIVISSTANSTVKMIRSLQDAKGRAEAGLFAAEGDRLCGEALLGDVRFRTLVLAESRSAETRFRDAAGRAGADIVVVTDAIFQTISDTKTPQGVMMLIPTELKPAAPEHGAEIRRAVVLDRLQDPGNMGTIIRAADAFGFDTVIVLKGSVDVYNPKTVRSTMGSLFHLNIFSAGSGGECLQLLRGWGVSAICAAADAEHSCTDEYISPDAKRAYIIGNEANGVTAELLEGCDIRLRIPMQGRAESLNASVAASVLMYEDMRKGTIR